MGVEGVGEEGFEPLPVPLRSREERDEEEKERAAGALGSQRLRRGALVEVDGCHGNEERTGMGMVGRSSGTGGGLTGGVAHGGRMATRAGGGVGEVGRGGREEEMVRLEA